MKNEPRDRAKIGIFLPGSESGVEQDPATGLPRRFAAWFRIEDDRVAGSKLLGELSMPCWLMDLFQKLANGAMVSYSPRHRIRTTR